MKYRPAYIAVFLTFARNSLVRDMSFRWNFILQCVTTSIWMGLQLVFFKLIFTFTDEIGKGTGWGEYEYFVFLATAMFINSIMQAFIMPNAEQFSEMIRTGTLDFALLKPIDTQFLISFQRVNWASLGSFALGVGVLVYALSNLDYRPNAVACVLYPLYVLLGVGVMYSVMIALASTSIWMGRNQSMFHMWFYLTNFSRYPMEIYDGRYGKPLRSAFTFVIPILVAINVPARFLAKPIGAQEWRLAVFAVFATAMSLWVSRKLFYFMLRFYKSASS